MAGAVEQLIEELSRLPGIGRKTASRLTFYLLKQPRESASRLSDAIFALTGLSGVAASIHSAE